MKNTTSRSRLPLRAIGLLMACVALAIPAIALAAEPKATTEPIDQEGVEQDYALLNGIINPGGIQTSYFFQYGETAEYGQTTPTIPIGAGRNDVGISVGLDGLKPNTTYHYRLVATYTPTSEYTAGRVNGADQTFTTLPPDAGPTPLALTISNRNDVSVDKKGVASFELACAGPADGACAGALTLKAKVKLPGAKKGKVLALGREVYLLDVGGTETVQLKLAKKVAKVIRKSKSKSLNATATTTTRKIAAPVDTKVKLVAAN